MKLPGWLGLWLVSSATLLATAAEEGAPQCAVCGQDCRASFAFPAYAFDRGNARTFTDRWADTSAMVAFGGESPVVVDYDIDFPVTATYELQLCYAAADARPVELSVDAVRVGQVCRSATGGWNTSQAKWEKACRLTLTAGKHTLRLERAGDFPHLVELRFDSPIEFPAGWAVDRSQARKLDSPPPVPAWARYASGAVDPAALRRAVMDLMATFGDRYPRGQSYLERLDQLTAAGAPDPTAAELQALRRAALLDNPLLDFDRMLIVIRGANSPELGLPRNWQGNSSLPHRGYDDQIAVLPLRPQIGEPQTLFQGPEGRFVGDIDLDFSGEKLLFSMPGDNDRWQVFEIRTDGSGLRQVTGEQPDVDSYDACYLPDGRIVFSSTACFAGVPCVYGSSHVANLYRMDADGRNIRQLCFDQEHNWCPTVRRDGSILYTRWEYTDTPHSNTRLLFEMNPDGTQQRACYGSNSYWPNSFFYTRPIPGHPTKLISVIGGHHDHPRMGELVIFDPALAQHEAGGAVQRIPGFDQPVAAVIRDGLTLDSWPKFLHPFPLSEKYHLVACKPSPQSLWGIYLVDRFDNLLLLKELPGYALLEPVPLRATPRPPVIADKTEPDSKRATVYIADIYEGPGLHGIPRGTVKSLRIFTYHYAYQDMGGLLGVIGMDGPWDIKRVLGTVPVHTDGSVSFYLPANTPVSIQPLDAEGKALQLMRSWMTAMPGEKVSCTGCHAPHDAAPRAYTTTAQSNLPAEIQPWYGPERGFSYAREVQPVIDRYCVGCHNGQPSAEGGAAPDLRGDVKLTDWSSITPGNGGSHAGKFSVGYAQLHRYVRRPGIESDYHMLEPMEFHADTTQLVQMLRKGHHGVQLDRESWDRLITWIDLNCPYHGTWGEEIDNPGHQRQRRRELLQRYGGVDLDSEAVPQTAVVLRDAELPVAVTSTPPVAAPVELSGWPFDSDEARRRQEAEGKAVRRRIEVGDGLSIELVRIPAGQFVMGSAQGTSDEQPLAPVKIDRPFWMATLEVTNAVYHAFDPQHDSRVESKNAYQFGIHGYPVNRPDQPVVRVSWQEAMAFCRWLSARTGERLSLPTEAQWEWACRAGAATDYHYGDIDADFALWANLADATLSQFASDPYTVANPLDKPTPYDDWLPKDSRFRDGAVLSIAPGSYRPNAWGLFDMHGNVAEWTRSALRPYPYQEDGRNDAEPAERRVVRGGSWRDRPAQSTASYRLSYQPYQRVYNIGFRVVIEE